MCRRPVKANAGASHSAWLNADEGQLMGRGRNSQSRPQADKHDRQVCGTGSSWQQRCGATAPGEFIARASDSLPPAERATEGDMTVPTEAAWLGPLPITYWCQKKHHERHSHWAGSPHGLRRRNMSPMRFSHVLCHRTGLRALKPEPESKPCWAANQAPDKNYCVRC